MTEENEKLIDEYIAFVQSTSKKYEQIGELASGNEVTPNKVNYALSMYYDTCRMLNDEYQRVKVEKTALELEYEELYAAWFQEAKEQLMAETSTRSAKPALKEIEQQLKVTHKMDYFAWQRKLAQAEMKCDHYIRMRETLNKFDNVLTNLAVNLRSELRALNIEDRANARQKFAPIR